MSLTLLDLVNEREHAEHDGDFRTAALCTLAIGDNVYDPNAVKRARSTLLATKWAKADRYEALAEVSRIIERREGGPR